jgi:sulfur relay (sulfurtransferase) DsrC/TusE family protein
LLKLIGISAVGAVGSRFAHTLKTTPNDQTARYLIGKGWYNWNEVDVQELATFRKLLLTDDRLDVYKFQIAIFTIIVALYVIFAGKNGLSDVKISETMLYLIGISQGVYVAGKAVTDRTTDLDAAVQKMIDLEPQIRAKEAALAAGAPRPPDLVALDQQYERAAITAAEEFSSLQHRLYPSDAAGGGWTKDLTHINPAVKRP